MNSSSVGQGECASRWAAPTPCRRSISGTSAGPVSRQRPPGPAPGGVHDPDQRRSRRDRGQHLAVSAPRSATSAAGPRSPARRAPPSSADQVGGAVARPYPGGRSSTRCATPRPASQRATSRQAPAPPVIRTVRADGVQGPPVAPGGRTADRPGVRPAPPQPPPGLHPWRPRAPRPAAPRATSEPAGTVDRAAPALGPLQGGDPAETHTLRLVRARAAGRSRPTATAPLISHQRWASPQALGVARRVEHREEATHARAAPGAMAVTCAPTTVRARAVKALGRCGRRSRPAAGVSRDHVGAGRAAASLDQRPGSTSRATTGPRRRRAPASAPAGRVTRGGGQLRRALPSRTGRSRPWRQSTSASPNGARSWARSAARWKA